MRYRLGVSLVCDDKLTAKERRAIKEQAVTVLNRFHAGETSSGSFYFDRESAHLTTIKEAR